MLCCISFRACVPFFSSFFSTFYLGPSVRSVLVASSSLICMQNMTKCMKSIIDEYDNVSRQKTTKKNYTHKLCLVAAGWWAHTTPRHISTNIILPYAWHDLPFFSFFTHAVKWVIRIYIQIERVYFAHMPGRQPTNLPTVQPTDRCEFSVTTRRVCANDSALENLYQQSTNAKQTNTRRKSGDNTWKNTHLLLKKWLIN